MYVNLFAETCCDVSNFEKKYDYAITLTSARGVMFLRGVCLFASQQDCTKRTGSIFMKLGERMQHWVRRKLIPLDFVSESWVKSNNLASLSLALATLSLVSLVQYLAV